jgi:glycosyltransferase involved in cell wall biosynthesis
MAEVTFTVAQLGARRHYAVPAILQSAGLLEHFFTDISAIKGWPRLATLMPPKLRPQGLRRLIGRIPQGVPAERVTAFNLVGLRYARLLRRHLSEGEQAAINIWAGTTFCNLVRDRGLGSASGVYVFSSAGLELLKAAKSEGRRAVLEQVIAPRRIEIALMKHEQEAFPDWQARAPSSEYVDAFCAREEAEWSLADLILCGSEFVRAGIAECNGPAERCVVVPYGVASHAGENPVRAAHGGPLRVLVVGAVGLRKGSPYVELAAKRLKGRATIRMLGPLDVSPKARAGLSASVELVGSVPRSQVAEHLAWADVFLLPSLCEGSAAATYEALAAGLPVICTPNTGSVVRSGVEGFIVPIRDVDAIVNSIDRLIEDRELRLSMSENARKRAQEFDLTSYGHRLVSAVLSARPNGAAP